MSTIKEIRVKNLFGYLNYSIPLNTTDNITIIHGPNGCGKTWILQLINAVFSLNYPVLQSAPIEEIGFDFRDGGHFAVRRQVEERPSGYQVSIYLDRVRPPSAKLVFAYSSKRTKKPKEFQLRTPRSLTAERHFPLSLIEREIPYLDRIGSEEWFDNSRNQVLHLSDVFNIYGRRLPWAHSVETTPRWLTDLTKRVNINFIQSQRLIRIPSTRGSREEPSSRKDILEMVELYSSELADRISKTLAESVKISQSRDRTFPTRLLRGEFSTVASEVQLRDELSKMETKRQQLYSTGLLDEEEAVPLPQKSMNEMEQKVLSLYLYDTREKLQVFDDLQNRIATLMSLINSKIEVQGKSLVISREKGFVFKTKLGADRTLRPSELSSGEQHQLVLFYEFLFKTAPKCLILIDEPEISLNVGWQRRFLDDLSRIVRLGGHSVLMATHSPQIIHNRWDLAVPLSGGVRNDSDS